MRHAIITAGSKGIGRKVTEAFLQKGCSVTVNYYSDEDRIKELIEEWEPYKEQLQFVQGNVTRKEDIANIVEQAMSRFGRIDYLINNAGPYIFERKKLVDYEDSEWYEMIDGNLNAVYHFLKLTIPVMRKQRFGRIITYGFQDAEHSPGWMYRSAFSAAKVGLASLTRTIALEEAEYGITANMVCPGDIVGEMKEADIEAAREIKHEQTPIGRSGTGEDIARLIGFICDKDSDLITGSIISASGGINVVNRHKK
ncbi:putative oxidoreductase YtkK [Siminovitchia terrae]|uniref:Oxidoreductase YtkK n=1 Tax=Siminovitchia terrae TaxID=1914933 RepID=A0A429X3X1_SIMTE|nr:SDR family oxidoreductase [Siminovitchia terrae]RST58050.1 SDR family oxidoreductase [Siminovitchia terrae]GIN91616.1 putative oxidoreductase YtkK [Siminovitchia terrae]GIN95707.1 putative oxidoreductase YtkK [Siminovitchia terrae]